MVQFDINLREFFSGLNCICIDLIIVSDFFNIVIGSYLFFNNMKGFVILDSNVYTELFCSDESELFFCRNFVMDMFFSEWEMMCFSDMLEFSDNLFFIFFFIKELEKQNVFIDSLDKNFSRLVEYCCQDGSLESSDGNLCINCCFKKEDYFFFFDGS